MRIGAVTIIFICLLASVFLYLIYYFIAPIIASGWYLNHTYAVSKFENGFFWVKLKKEDKDYWVYKIDVTGVKVKDVCWQMFFKHKEAYELYLAGRNADDRSNR